MQKPGAQGHRSDRIRNRVHGPSEAIEHRERSQAEIARQDVGRDIGFGPDAESDQRRGDDAQRPSVRRQAGTFRVPRSITDRGTGRSRIERATIGTPIRTTSAPRTLQACRHPTHWMSDAAAVEGRWPRTRRQTSQWPARCRVVSRTSSTPHASTPSASCRSQPHRVGRKSRTGARALNTANWLRSCVSNARSAG
jgi:hypothetical protein